MKLFKRVCNKLKRDWRELNPIFWLPVKKNLILFESTSDLCDNSKALYDEMIRRELYKKYRFVWMVEDVEYCRSLKLPYTEFYHYSDKNMSALDTFRYWFLNSRAKYCFYTHKPLGCYKKKRQQRVFLTHGTPLKDSRGKFWNVNYNTFIVSTSDFAADLRCEAFLGGRDKVIKTGFPRNDRLFLNHDDVMRKLALENFDKVILWMPTFKHLDVKNSRIDMQNSDNVDLSIINNDFVQHISSVLSELNYVLVIKFHPHQDMKYVPQISNYNIKTLTNGDLQRIGIDSYDLMAVSDALITDFSSVYLDYLLLDRPMAFELTDLDSYKDGVGFLVQNPLEYMPGFKISSANEFESFLLKLDNLEELFADDRRKLCKLMHDNIDGKSSERLLQTLNINM